MNAVTDKAAFADFHVADLKLADWGRKEIAIAETEMPRRSHRYAARGSPEAST